MYRNIKSSQRLVRVLTAKVDTTDPGELLRGSRDFAFARTGVGDVTLTPVTPGARILHASVQPVADAGDLVATLHSDTDETQVRVVLWDCTDGTTAKEGVFYLRVEVSDDADEN